MNSLLQELCKLYEMESELPFLSRILSSSMMPIVDLGIGQGDKIIVQYAKSKCQNRQDGEALDQAYLKLKACKEVLNPQNILYFLASVSQDNRMGSNSYKSPLRSSRGFMGPSMSSSDLFNSSPPRPRSGKAQQKFGSQSTLILQGNSDSAIGNSLLTQQRSGYGTTMFKVPSSSNSFAQFVSNADVLDDLFKILMGLDGKNITINVKLKSLMIDRDVNKSIQLLINLIADELLWAYLKLKSAAVVSGSKIGVFRQSFNSIVKQQLDLYENFVIELQMQRSINIQLIYVQLRPWMRLLQELNHISMQCKDMEGVQLLNRVHALHQLQYGVSLKDELFTSLQNAMNSLLLSMISDWISNGTVVDVHGEFFIQNNVIIEDWVSRHLLDRYTVQRILSIGKTLQFLQEKCKNFKYAQNRHNLKLEQLANVSQYIQQEFDRLQSHALDIVLNQVHLVDTLSAMKYLLLGEAGDFMRSVIGHFDRVLCQSADSIERHRLISNMEDAIMNSVAVQMIDFHPRLDVKLLALPGAASGWDIFTLTYLVDGPLSVVIDEQCLAIYHKLFQFILKFQRLLTDLEQAFDHVRFASKQQASDMDTVMLEIGHIRSVVQSLCNYIFVEGVERYWLDINDKIKSCRDLDSLITLHKSELIVMQKTVLFSAGKDIDGISAVLNIMSLADQYCQALKNNDVTTADITRQQNLASVYLQFDQQRQKLSRWLLKDQHDIAKVLLSYEINPHSINTQS
ncbi:hypothetical protein MIR68_000637 [Amoeboaphelidium protococcarum]|nr:hypothetical protein MIR68_000637 [Amoeboaphelidium protococcarum]